MAPTRSIRLAPAFATSVVRRAQSGASQARRLDIWAASAFGASVSRVRGKVGRQYFPNRCRKALADVSETCVRMRTQENGKKQQDGGKCRSVETSRNVRKRR